MEKWQRESDEAGKWVELEATQAEKEADPNEAVDLCECYFPEDEGPAYEEFAKHQNHDFWTWCQAKQGWYHVDETTKETIWAPDEFD